MKALFSEEVKEEILSDDAKARVAESMGVWSVWIGGRLFGHFGLIPLGMARAWIWAEVCNHDITISHIRAFRRALNEFFSTRPYDLAASACGGRNCRFLEFLGFQLYGSHESDLIYARSA